MTFGSDFEAKERVRQATDIVDLVSRHLNLRRQGRNLVGVCPFHDDRRPSLQVNPDRQTWKCWVCDIGGDVFSFVMQREGVEFPEALRMLAERAGIELDRERRGPAPAPGGPEDKQTLYRAMQWTVDQFHRCLCDSPTAASTRAYLDERGFTNESVERFAVGFAPDEWSWLLDRARSTPYSADILRACGLIEQSQKTQSYYDRFRGRLIFPIRDTQQRPIALGGRVLPESAAQFETKTGRAPAKYINSPETKLYTKSDHLFGLDLVRDDASRSRQLVIVEGYTDVIMAWQSGLRNVAAVLGTALNERHLRLIKRFADRITLVLDGDEAGQKRTAEVLDLFVAADIDLRVLALPDGFDPCDYLLTQGSEPFVAMIDGAPDALDFRIDRETDGIDVIHDSHRASQALDNILRTIARVPRLQLPAVAATQLREQSLIAKLARRFHAVEGDLRVQLQRIRQQQRTPGESVTPPPSDRLDGVERHESETLQILIASPEKIDGIVENISPDQFVIGPVRDIYETYCHCYHTSGAVDFPTMMTMIEDPTAKALFAALDEGVQDKLAEGDLNLDAWIEDVVRRFRRLANDAERRRLIAAGKDKEMSAEEESRALERILEQKLTEQNLQRPGAAT